LFPGLEDLAEQIWRTSLCWPMTAADNDNFQSAALMEALWDTQDCFNGSRRQSNSREALPIPCQFPIDLLRCNLLVV
jgi:hypothetical protein